MPTADRELCIVYKQLRRGCHWKGLPAEEKIVRHATDLRPGDSLRRQCDAVEKYFSRCQREINSVLKKTGLADVPVWSTEFDYPSAVKHQVRGRYKGHSAEEGPEKQALFLKEWFPRLFDSQPERKVFWASLVDDVNDEGAFLSTGLVHWKSNDDKHGMGARKPAHQALKQSFNARQP